MSVSISILIRGSVSAEDVLAELRTEGLSLSSTESGLWNGTFVGIDLALVADPGFEDDAGLPLSQFEVQVSFKRYAGEDSELREALMAALGTLLAARLARRRGWHCLVVRDVQAKLAEYKPAGAGP